MVRVRKPPFRRPSPRWFHGDCEAHPWLPPGRLQRRNKAIMLDKEGRVESEDREPTTSEDSGATLLRGLYSKFFHNVVNLFHYVVRLNQISNS